MTLKKILSLFLTLTLTVMMTGCQDKIESVEAFTSDKAPIPQVINIKEVNPPKLIQELNKNFAQKQPQVKIISPADGKILDTTSAEVKLTVSDLTIFKDDNLKMGPHLHFFLDDQPYQAIYSTEEPVLLTDLAPGTHTIRVFASRPWHESFKNEGAYAQTTFHVFTPTEDNNPNNSLPLLTYSRPQGTYGAEPIMLDFYLTNAPLHLAAQENSEDNIRDWRIRITINGEVSIIDTWQPLYLTGFNQGENWVKLEFIDDQGDVLKNVFNSTVRVINFDPKFNDTLSKLVTGKISLSKAQAITIPNYPVSEIEEEVIENSLTQTEEIITETSEESLEVIENNPAEIPEETLDVIESNDAEISEESLDVIENNNDENSEEGLDVIENNQAEISEESLEITENNQAEISESDES
ncbi:MAG: hypothetical protein IGQ45_02840 [Cyanobacterium sp. T60_A2020_053]|nr:hypothetical protein [Cyanobacterium sp. T60_A2020_053]